jgi:hypothetical protein
MHHLTELGGFLHSLSLHTSVVLQQLSNWLHALDIGTMPSAHLQDIGTMPSSHLQDIGTMPSARF